MVSRTERKGAVKVELFIRTPPRLAFRRLPWSSTRPRTQRLHAIPCRGEDHLWRLSSLAKREGSAHDYHPSNLGADVASTNLGPTNAQTITSDPLGQSPSRHLLPVAPRWCYNGDTHGQVSIVQSFGVVLLEDEWTNQVVTISFGHHMCPSSPPFLRHSSLAINRKRV